MHRYYDTRRVGVPSFAGEIGPGRGAGLSTALTAAVAVIAIGSFIVHGAKGIELPREGPGPVPSVRSTITSR
jgi:hypothetical protein